MMKKSSPQVRLPPAAPVKEMLKSSKPKPTTRTHPVKRVRVRPIIKCDTCGILIRKNNLKKHRENTCLGNVSNMQGLSSLSKLGTAAVACNLCGAVLLKKCSGNHKSLCPKTFPLNRNNKRGNDSAPSSSSHAPKRLKPMTPASKESESIPASPLSAESEDIDHSPASSVEVTNETETLATPPTSPSPPPVPVPEVIKPAPEPEPAVKKRAHKVPPVTEVVKVNNKPNGNKKVVQIKKMEEPTSTNKPSQPIIQPVKRRCLKCSVCGAEREDAISMQKHKSSHTKEDIKKLSFPCTYCDQVFKFYFTHRAHLLKSHSEKILEKHVEPGTKLEDLRSSLEEVLVKSRERGRNGKPQCTLCRKECGKDDSEVDNHVLVAHFDTIVVKLRNVLKEKNEVKNEVVTE